MLRISETFYSVQGEGIHQGLPTLFIRLQGCNLLPGHNCKFCDTGYAQKEGGENYTLERLMDKVESFPVKYNGWICATGGEPLWQQEELESLVDELKKRFHPIEVFTNGSIVPPRWWTKVDSWVVDMKTPSSGVCGISKEAWYDIRYLDQIKFTVGNEKDLLWSRDQIRKYRNQFKGTILVSPIFDPNAVMSREFAIKVVEFCKEENVRLSVQVHKFLWGNRKGV